MWKRILCDNLFPDVEVQPWRSWEFAHNCCGWRWSHRTEVGMKESEEPAGAADLFPVSSWTFSMNSSGRTWTTSGGCKYTTTGLDRSLGRATCLLMVAEPLFTSRAPGLGPSSWTSAVAIMEPRCCSPKKSTITGESELLSGMCSNEDMACTINVNKSPVLPREDEDYENRDLKCIHYIDTWRESRVEE